MHVHCPPSAMRHSWRGSSGRERPAWETVAESSRALEQGRPDLTWHGSSGRRRLAWETDAGAAIAQPWCISSKESRPAGGAASGCCLFIDEYYQSDSG